jgi:hypothetical protein
MATEPASETAAWQLPEKWTEDTVDETGSKLSKRYICTTTHTPISIDRGMSTCLPIGQGPDCNSAFVAKMGLLYQ